MFSVLLISQSLYILNMTKVNPHKNRVRLVVYFYIQGTSGSQISSNLFTPNHVIFKSQTWDLSQRLWGSGASTPAHQYAAQQGGHSRDTRSGECCELE